MREPGTQESAFFAELRWYWRLRNGGVMPPMFIDFEASALSGWPVEVGLSW
ncbi:hypothetical protein [Defluviimonas sp. WL0075]|uniref:Uncharacterized protein n=1 Tax=Albidovulum sediminicola TaxID=2984331 RepID=A0ABT2Z6H2_9RHOB|nr:hypothetical protein [Defluviimonas sp. WL0075]MCV2866702.1 hypothetical protein [Defluviimonas sp. WL0075]